MTDSPSFRDLRIMPTIARKPLLEKMIMRENSTEYDETLLMSRALKHAALRELKYGDPFSRDNPLSRNCASDSRNCEFKELLASPSIRAGLKVPRG